MSISAIIVPIATLGGLSIVFSIMLAVSYKKFAVYVDPKVEKITASLPGVNCGACGFAGCQGFAEAVVALKAEAGGCVAGGPDTAKKIGEILGIEATVKETEVAFVACRAGRTVAKFKYAYEGVWNCQAAHLLFGGDKLCEYGCLGLGSCVTVCPFDAMHINAEGLAVVDPEKCKACRKCIAACPRKLIYMVPKSQNVLVACMNKDKGRKAKEVCKMACIACKICEKNCPSDAIHVIDNLAVIDFGTCTQCGICVQKCPQKTIIDLAHTVAEAEKGGPGGSDAGPGEGKKIPVESA
jgi:Na+-translocating ferredoxin:NAD+ oxidoreductase subunit B